MYIPRAWIDATAFVLTIWVGIPFAAAAIWYFWRRWGEGRRESVRDFLKAK